jgi:hypothetical protein
MGHRVINEYSEAVCALSLAAQGLPDELIQRQLTATADTLIAHAALQRALLPPVDSGPRDLGSYPSVYARRSSTPPWRRAVYASPCAPKKLS